MIYLQLFWEFLKIGLFAVGGGMATVPFLYDLSAKTGWFSEAQLIDLIAVSESTPGPIGLNMATYVGYTTAGLLGSIVASIALIIPSMIIILIIVRILEKFRNNRIVDVIFYGLRPTSAALIASAGISVAMVSILNVAQFKATGVFTDIFNVKAIILAAAVWILTNKVKKTKGFHPIIFILASAVIGVIFSF